MPTGTPLTLESVTLAFTAWRAKPPRGRKVIPAGLRQQAVALLSQYRAAQIRQALSVNAQQLRQWQACAPPDPVKPAIPVVSPSVFVALEPESEIAPHRELLALKWTTETVKGVPLSVEGALSLEQWSAVIPLFEQEGR